VEAGEEERGEMPDGFLGADLPQAASGEPAADREGKGTPLAGKERRDSEHDSDDGARVRTGQQPREEGARERQVRPVVSEDEAPDDPEGEGKAEAGGKDQPFRPVALLGQEDPAKPLEPHQHRGQHGPDGQLRHQREDRHLLAGQYRVVGHVGSLPLAVYRVCKPPTANRKLDMIQG
jgi:hypothetical protein